MRWVLPLVVLGGLLTACGDGGSSAATLSAPSPEEAAERAAADHDGYAVTGCDYVRRLHAGTTAPVADLRVTLATLARSATVDTDVRSTIEVARMTETARDFPTVVRRLRHWCEDEGLISPL